jgi:hypothetical protein
VKFRNANSRKHRRSIAGSQDKVRFRHTGDRDFGNPEDKEPGHFDIGNPKVPKEACGHREKWNFSILAFRHFGGSRSQGTRHLGS